MAGMFVYSRTIIDERVDIRHCDQDLYFVRGQRFSHRKLVKVTGVVIID